jgi:hypothetical protein
LNLGRFPPAKRCNKAGKRPNAKAEVFEGDWGCANWQSSQQSARKRVTSKERCGTAVETRKGVQRKDSLTGNRRGNTLKV